MTAAQTTASQDPTLPRGRPRVVIVGSGFGGLFAAKRLRRAKVDVTLISETPNHVFQPLLYQVATGILSEGLIAPPTREILEHSRNTEVLLGTVTEIDLAGRRVVSRLGEVRTVTEYDHLIVAAGAGSSYFGHDEYELFAPGLKTLDDAKELRARIFGAFEAAELLAADQDVTEWLTFVVVGAGPTGVEMAGQIRELAQRALKRNFRRIDPATARVILVDGADQVLTPFGESQGRHTEKSLEKLGIEVKLEAMVSEVDAQGVTVTHRDGTTERIGSRCKVWAAGVSASPLAAQLAAQVGLEVDSSGRIPANGDLTLPGHPEVFVVGDMVTLNNYPGVAQVAMQGGAFAAKRIKRTAAGKPIDPEEQFHYFDKGSMATISRFRAVANIGPLKVRGFLAWLLWLFIHISFLVGFHQRVTTLGHWAVSFVGRARTERTFVLNDVELEHARRHPAEPATKDDGAGEPTAESDQH
ncbi:MAG: NAD(P)/FAD-dependent oxidoreductase [Actinobacteria bacterium]|nr:NAD(P)/FAD-dependent oxidoreductase [Actinomycetota bacterium]